MKKLAKWIYRQCGKWECLRKILQKDKEKMQLLYPGQSWQKHLEAYYTETILLVMKVLLVGMLLAGGFAGYQLFVPSLQIHSLSRNLYGEGAKYVDVEVWGGNGYAKEYRLEVAEREYTEEELNSLSEKLKHQLDRELPGDNASLDKVVHNLYFPPEVPGFPFGILWRTSDPDVINSKGELAPDYFSGEKQVLVSARLQCGLFEKTYEWVVTVCPGVWTSEEIQNHSVEKALEISHEATIHGDEWVLPEEVNGEELYWYLQRDNVAGVMVGMLVLVVILIVWGRNNDLQRRLKGRDGFLEEEYHNVVTKLTLYLGAGMTVKAAWRKTATVQLLDNPKSIVAKEMQLTIREMDSGGYESVCYEDFGRRCGRQEYIRLGTLLSQNLKKGNWELLNRLQEEVQTASENKKHFVRRRGEEASTKLLGPMVMLLGITMILIMVPALYGIG